MQSAKYLLIFLHLLIIKLRSISCLSSISDPTDEETERGLVVKPPSWWSSIINKEKELRVVTIGGSNTAEEWYTEL